ncbi:hypothetical protein [Natrinema pallidum]|uniref:hypothetical protein n=1 Tax=Natrinema pallidum TaxID=69527 RepID=UPI0012686AAD|nr:hypothetical protein [Natrinema pallidum]
MNLDYYISWSSDGHFEHNPVITTAHEANRQTGRDSRGDPVYTTEGWITESELNVKTISDGWLLSDRENEYLECCPGVASDANESPNEFFTWGVDFLVGNTPGVGTLKDLFDGGSALVQTLYDQKDPGYTTTYKWDYDNDNSGNLRDGESYPYTDSQTFKPLEKVNHDGHNNRSAEAVFRTTWRHKGGGGAPDAPVAGFEIEVPTPDTRFDEMSSSEKDDWGVKTADDSRFPLSGTTDDDLVATDPPAEITFLSNS